jgi:hypothetical protein
MRKYREIVVPEKKATVTDGTFCDICGQNLEYDGHEKRSCYDRTSVEIKYETGNIYPEGGTYHIWETDICPNCFEEKVRPALEALGAVFRFRTLDI